MQRARTILSISRKLPAWQILIRAYLFTKISNKNLSYYNFLNMMWDILSPGIWKCHVSSQLFQNFSQLKWSQMTYEILASLLFGRISKCSSARAHLGILPCLRISPYKNYMNSNKRSCFAAWVFCSPQTFISTKMKFYIPTPHIGNQYPLYGEKSIHIYFSARKMCLTKQKNILRKRRTTLLYIMDSSCSTNSLLNNPFLRTVWP